MAAIGRARAERRMGELLIAMKESGERATRGGVSGSGNVAPRDIGTQSLTDLGNPRDVKAQESRRATLSD